MQLAAAKVDAEEEHARAEVPPTAKIHHDHVRRPLPWHAWALAVD